MKLLRTSILPLLACAASLNAQTPQTAAPKPVSLTGCVSKLPNADYYVLAAANQCYLLSGTSDPAKTAGFLVTFRGTVQELSATAPLTLIVAQTQSIAAACSVTCKLILPGTRGIHGKPKPGQEGGPPGRTQTPALPPEQ